MKILKSGLGFFLTGLLVACAVGPKYERPEITSPEKFRNDTLLQRDSILNLKWWELFNDPALDSLINISLRENKDLLIAASRIEQARANYGINKADFFPQFQIGAGIGSGNFGGGLFVFPEKRQVLSTTGQFAWELDFWGKIRRSTEAAKAEILASEFGMRTIQVGLITEVARAYFQLIDYWMRYEIAKRTFASRDSGHQIILDRYEAGIVPLIDVNQSEIQLAISEAAIPSYRRSIAISENNLSILLGQNPDSIAFGKSLFEQEVNPSIPAGIPSELLNRRPDILEAEAKLHAQTARIGISQASRLPSISLTGTMGMVSQDLTSLNSGELGWNVGAGLFGPLFEWGKNKRRVDVEKEKTEQAMLQYEKSILIAFGEVENALRTIETIKDELAARKRQYEAASNAELLAFERYNGGVTSYLEVLENQRYSFEAELLYSQTYQQYLNAHVSLYKALGGGWISEEEMNNAENTDEQK